MKIIYKYVLFTIIIISFFFISACQSTPTDKVVTNKGDNSLNKLINQSPVPNAEGKYPAPDIWKETLSGLRDDLTINIDANIEIPNVDAYPVAKIEPDEITQEDADKIMDVLIRDEQLIMPMANDLENPTTKKAIGEEILRLKESIINPNSNLNYFYEKGTEEYNEKLAEINKKIDVLEHEIVNAPEKMPINKISRKFKSDYPGWYNIKGYTQTSYIDIVRPIEEPFYWQRIVFNKKAFHSEFSSKISNLKGITISQEDAEKKAYDFLKNLGINNMQISLTCSAYQTSLFDDNTMDNIYETPQCFAFIFTKNVEGIPITYQETRLDSEQLTKQFAPIFPQESIKVIIDDNGILEFVWEPPSKVTNILNSNVELLPYEDIQKIFK
ncbi:MAG: DUF6034 family protein, partial [Eubacteriaceae bacterium]